MELKRALGCGLCVLLLTPVSALAQAASTFADVPGVLEIGRKVVVRDVDGHKTTGRVAEITPTSLTLVAEDSWGTKRQQVLSSTAIRSINRTDSVWNGLLIGLGAGIVGSELFVRGNCGPPGYDSECTAIVRLVGIATFVPGGAIVGALVDRFTGNRLIYRAPQPSTVLVTPIVGRGTAGVSLALRF